MFKYVSPGFFQTCRHATDRRPRFHLDRSLWPPARWCAFPRIWRASCGARPSAAVGKRISTELRVPWREVIGVVEDVRENGVQEPAPAIVYWPSFGENIYVAGSGARGPRR